MRGLLRFGASPGAVDDANAVSGGRRAYVHTACPTVIGRSGKRNSNPPDAMRTSDEPRHTASAAILIIARGNRAVTPQEASVAVNLDNSATLVLATFIGRSKNSKNANRARAFRWVDAEPRINAAPAHINTASKNISSMAAASIVPLGGVFRK
jgi:hypothetical protein